MYNIIQINDKNLSELQVIAKELGIKKADSYKKEDLVYKILDEQAIVGLDAEGNFYWDGPETNIIIVRKYFFRYSYSVT